MQKCRHSPRLLSNTNHYIESVSHRSRDRSISSTTTILPLTDHVISQVSSGLSICRRCACLRHCSLHATHRYRYRLRRCVTLGLAKASPSLQAFLLRHALIIGDVQSEAPSVERVERFPSTSDACRDGNASVIRADSHQVIHYGIYVSSRELSTAQHGDCSRSRHGKAWSGDHVCHDTIRRTVGSSRPRRGWSVHTHTWRRVL